MKLHKLTIPLLAATLVATSYFATLQVFAYYTDDGSETNPAITLTLPDQEYTISLRDLEGDSRELVIPIQDEVTPKISYNKESGKIENVDAPKEYVVEVEHLRADVARLGTQEPLRFTPTYSIRNQGEGDVTAYNERLNRIYRNPLNISLKDGSNFTELELPSSVLRALLNPTSIESNVPPTIDQQTLLTYLTSRLTAKQKEYFNGSVAYENTKKAINLRFMGEATPTVLGVDDGPSSNGELAGRYLEVDLSQQKMYFFIDRALYKEYKISTGAEYPTPVGEYHILNKAPLAWSGIYSVWMPYWMGFKYAGDVGAYLGLHEIAYAVDAGGKPIYPLGNYIGDKMTGGCVALQPGDSREVYNLSTVGMLVRIVH